MCIRDRAKLARANRLGARLISAGGRQLLSESSRVNPRAFFATRDIPPSPSRNGGAHRVRSAGDGAVFGAQGSRVAPAHTRRGLHVPRGHLRPRLVHRVVAHLLHLLGSFGFVGPAKVAEGLDVMLADPDAMLGATFAAFDANGDGAIDATDLATTLSLARPFFGVPHAELVAKFDAVLRGAGGPRGPKARHGIRRSDLDSVLMYTPALEAWTLTPICLLYTSPSPRDQRGSRMPSSA